MGGPPLRPVVSTVLKERRLEALLGGCTPEELGLPERVRAAQVLGSLELSGESYPFEEVLEAGRGGAAAGPLASLFVALRAVEAKEPFSKDALLRWGAALTGVRGFREEDRSREDGPPPSPPRFIESRVQNLEEWLNAEATRQLKPSQLGALALARLVEILPFPDGNGRIARLCASHVMIRAGGQRPILVRGDGPALRAALESAFQLVTEPLSSLLEGASGRGLDVMIQSLSGPGKGP